MIRSMLGAMAFAALFFSAQHAAAVIITAKITAFENHPATVAGVGTGGGIATFSLVGSDAPIVGELSSIIDASFQAICLEPDSFISVGQTYDFLLTDLGAAPTVTGGMGAAREVLIEEILGRAGLVSVESLTSAQASAMTALLYEAGYEAAGNALDLSTGTAVVTGAGAPLASSYVASIGPKLFDVDAFALINLGPTGTSAFSVFEGQDFAVWTASPVPAPGALALIGVGFLGLVALRKRVA